MSLQRIDHSRLVSALPMWCAMPPARGEKIVTFVPRSRWSLSCAPSTLSRSWSSEIFKDARDGVCDGSFKASIWRLRQSRSSFGSVV